MEKPYGNKVTDLQYSRGVIPKHQYTNAGPCKVIGVLVALLFAQKALPFGPNVSLDHVEAFAGEHSVTIGEMEDSILQISQSELF